MISLIPNPRSENLCYSFTYFILMQSFRVVSGLDFTTTHNKITISVATKLDVSGNLCTRAV